MKRILERKKNAHALLGIYTVYVINLSVGGGQSVCVCVCVLPHNLGDSFVSS